MLFVPCKQAVSPEMPETTKRCDMEREPFLSWYLRRAKEVQSVLCVGLDPTYEHLPPQWRPELDYLFDYMKRVVNLAAKHAAVVKPQSAYYEDFGPEGTRALINLVEYAHGLGLPVILDAKRQDIGPTDARYADSVFGVIDADACTRNTYLGSTFMPSSDGKCKGWLPWLDIGRAALPMIRTSNPEAVQLQDQRLESGFTVYEWAAEQAATLDREVSCLTSGRGSVGGVVGATWPEQAVRCRKLAPDVFFLIPGYGAQGGGAEGAVAGFPADGRLLGTVNSSRGITQAWRDKDGRAKPGDPLDWVAAAIHSANSELNTALAAHLGHNPY